MSLCCSWCFCSAPCADLQPWRQESEWTSLAGEQAGEVRSLHHTLHKHGRAATQGNSCLCNSKCGCCHPCLGLRTGLCARS